MCREMPNLLVWRNGFSEIASKPDLVERNVSFIPSPSVPTQSA